MSASRSRCDEYISTSEAKCAKFTKFEKNVFKILFLGHVAFADPGPQEKKTYFCIDFHMMYGNNGFFDPCTTPLTEIFILSENRS